MKNKIMSLRKEGKTYTQIQEILGCSRGTISYHCGEKQKERSLQRQKNNRRSTRSIVLRKIDLFIGRNNLKKLTYSKRTELHELMYNKIINNPYCYITGDRIELSDGGSYCLDHINPFHISEDSSIDNLGVATKAANASKAHLTVDEYIKLCEKVIKHNSSNKIRVMD